MWAVMLGMLLLDLPTWTTMPSMVVPYMQLMALVPDIMVNCAIVGDNAQHDCEAM